MRRGWRKEGERKASWRRCGLCCSLKIEGELEWWARMEERQV